MSFSQILSIRDLKIFFLKFFNIKLKASVNFLLADAFLFIIFYAALITLSINSSTFLSSISRTNAISL